MKYSQDIKKENIRSSIELIPTSAIKSLSATLTLNTQKQGGEIARQQILNETLHHLVAYIDNPSSKDTESGLFHIEHVLCNVVLLNDLQTAKTTNMETSNCLKKTYSTWKYMTNSRFVCENCGHIVARTIPAECPNCRSEMRLEKTKNS